MNRFSSVGIVLSLILLVVCRSADYLEAQPRPGQLPTGQPPQGQTKAGKFTTLQDHRQMMEQLKITKLRPGPSGDEKAPNHANYDEAKANPFQDLPDPLKCLDGTLVSTPEIWNSKRREEIVELFESEVYGRIPTNVPAVVWEVRQERESKIGEIEVVEKLVVGKVDNSAYPDIVVEISMSVTVPKASSQPVPLLIMFGPTAFDPAPGFGRPSASSNPPKQGQELRKNDESGKEVGKEGGKAIGNGQATNTPPISSRRQMLIEAGWGFAMLNPASIQADNGAGLTLGIIGLTNHGEPRKPDDWGALRAWGWGASRALDYLETNSAIDKAKVGIEGVSRYGKAALVTMAFDERFAIALVGSSGEGGAKLHRRNFGEAVESLTSSGEYHWMAGNFLKYGTEESEFGRRTSLDIPVDSHQLISLCAPRFVFISYGIPEKGDAKWLDQKGSFMAAVAAGKVYRLLGAKDLGQGDEYMAAKLPPVNEGLLDGELAWRQHDGGHTDTPNMPHFIEWANKKFAATSASNSLPTKN